MSSSRLSSCHTRQVDPATVCSRACLLLACMLLLDTGAAEAGALPDPDLTPMIVSVGLAHADEGAWLPGSGQRDWRWSVATASHSTQDADGQEALHFDGETTRLSLAAEYGLGERFSVGVEIPYLLHESGGLDHAIERWHDWFGFPNNLRNIVANDRIDFRYADGDRLLLDNQQNLRGPGDIRLLAGWQLMRNERSASALRLVLKLPTGDSARLTGSGNADLAIGIVGDQRDVLGNPRWSTFYRAYAVFVGQPDRLGARARPVIGQLSAGISLQALSRLSLTVQGSMRSAAYDSELRILGDPAMLLNVGGTLRLSDHLQLAIAVGEDIRVDTAPDVTFGISLSYVPGHYR